MAERTIASIAHPSNHLDAKHYREMQLDYLYRCAKWPMMDRSQIALKVCAFEFEIPIAQIIMSGRGRPQMAEIRQKMMAFSRVVSFATSEPNTWKAIGQAFNRQHSTVIHATQKYGSEIAAALELPNCGILTPAFIWPPNLETSSLRQSA